MCNSMIKTDHPVRHVNKVIIWSYKLHSHTHSYIHWAFYRAFKHLGYETYWFDDKDNTSNFDFSNSLFITMGATDNHRMPIRQDCYYIIHNGNNALYKDLVQKNRCIFLQVYTQDCLERNDTQTSFCFHHSLKDACIYMPWATDLLPYEIDEIKQKLPTVKKNNNVAFVGTMYAGVYGNEPEINSFKIACNEYKHPFNAARSSISMEENIKIIQEAYMAPALQGTWQCQKGYIPCRIFKNISYGAMGVTNSETVYKLFEGKITYNANGYQLYKDAEKALKNHTLEKQYALMDMVKNKHTYLNRIESLLNFFEMREEYLKG